MTDIEIFKTFMGWMKMNIYKEKHLEDGNFLIQFSDNEQEFDKPFPDNQEKEELFTKRGYEDFHAGIIFNKEGKMIKGYIDAHAVFMSDNFELIDKM